MTYKVRNICVVLFLALLILFSGCDNNHDNPTGPNSNGLLQPGTERDFPLGNTGLSVTMCWIPAGSFMMGAQDGEQDSYNTEDPRHEVNFGSGFWMGKYEVTQAQWEAVTGHNPARNYGVGTNYPVYYVSWDDIQGFESILVDAFRLPSEAEWEYACRAGTTTRFYWGDDPNYERIDEYAVYVGDEPNCTAEVGDKLPNAWGLHDMSGNVWEWCEDVWHENYNGAPEDASPWTQDGDQRYRLLRGGSLSDNPRYCRSANRLWGFPDNGLIYSPGFRLVRDAE